jgi:hypothetical protein
MRSAWQRVPVLGIGLWIASGPSGGSGSPGQDTAHPSRPQPPRQQSVTPDRTRGLPTPDILLTGSTRESRAVEARAAAFVRAVRGRNGLRAVRFLSRDTAAPVRAAVARRDWPWRTAPQDLALLFSQPALRLRTLGITRTHARVRVGTPPMSRRSREPAGFYDLRMVREGARWQVTLPASTRRQARTGG